eukprot:COSAG01_NODE_5935_length_3944_cov_24.526658_2_plen_249_part_00
MHDQGRSYGEHGETGSIGHAFSTDCRRWHYGPRPAATTTVAHPGGGSTTWIKRERPHLTFSSDGKMTPLAFFSGIMAIETAPYPDSRCTWADHGNKSIGFCDPAFTSVQLINNHSQQVKSEDSFAKIDHGGGVPRQQRRAGAVAVPPDNCFCDGAAHEKHGAACVGSAVLDCGLSQAGGRWGPAVGLSDDVIGTLAAVANLSVVTNLTLTNGYASGLVLGDVEYTAIGAALGSEPLARRLEVMRAPYS